MAPSRTAVMLGVTGILGDLRHDGATRGEALFPLHVWARHLLVRPSPRAVANSGLVLGARAAELLAAAPADSRYMVDLLPGLLGLGLGVGMVLVPASVSSMAASPHPTPVSHLGS